MDIKKCEYCGEEINVSASRCPYCGSIVKETPTETGSDVPPIPLEIDAEAKSEGSLSQPDLNPETDTQEFKAEVKEPLPAANTVDNQYNAPRYEQEQPGLLSNAAKVTLVVTSTIPGLGQLVGIIAAIIFMSNDRDSDRRSFGRALLAASLILFAFWGLCCVFFGLAGVGGMMSDPDFYRY